MSENTALVERFFGAVLGGDVTTLKELVSPDCIVHEPADLPYGGEYKGLDGVLAMFKAIATELSFEVNGSEIFDVGGGRVVVRMDATFTSLRNGRTASFPIAEIYTVANGQIVDIDVFYKEPAAIRALYAAA